MNFRNTNTFNYSLENESMNIKSYMILDKVPPDLYKEVLTWSEEMLDINNMTISISDNNAMKTLVVAEAPPVVVDGLGMCEVEFRGALHEINIEGHESLTLTTSFLPVLHYSNGINAMTMVLSREQDELDCIMNEVVIPRLSEIFNNILITENKEDIDLTMTTIFTNVEDVLSFMDESSRNIITTPFTFK